MEQLRLWFEPVEFDYGDPHRSASPIILSALGQYIYDSKLGKESNSFFQPWIPTANDVFQKPKL